MADCLWLEDWPSRFSASSRQDNGVEEDSRGEKLSGLNETVGTRGVRTLLET